MTSASARLDDARISLKHSVAVCKEIRNKKLEWAKNFLENLIDKKISLEGKYHTNAAKQILKILESAEANARVKNLNPGKLFVKSAKADKGEVFVKPKSRWRFRGRKAKVTRIEIELEER